MISIKLFRIFAATTVLAGALSANAVFDLGADYSFNYSDSVNFDTNIGAWVGNHTVNTAMINGDRSAGAAGGVTTLLPFAVYKYPTYCVEIGQTIGGGYNIHQSVTPLLGSSTNTGGNSGPVLFDAVRTCNLELLWGNFFGAIVDNDTSSAFQLAQWELTFDDDVTLLDNTQRMWTTNAGGKYAIAEAWLTAIRTGTVTNKQKLLLLSDPNVQDLITPVPEPASLTAIAIGAAALVRKRRAR